MKKTNMKRIISAILSLSMSFSMAMSIAGCVPASVIEAIENANKGSAIDLDGITEKNDFYGYVNAKYLMDADLTDGFSNVGFFDKAQDEINDMLIDEIIRIGTSDEKYTYGSKEYIIQNAYRENLQVFDEALVKAEMEKELVNVKETLNKFENASSPEELMVLCIENEVGLFPPLTVLSSPDDVSKAALYSPLITEVLGVNVSSVKENINAIDDNSSSYIKMAEKLGVSTEQAKEDFKKIAYVALEICWGTDDEALIERGNETDGTIFIDENRLNEILTSVDLKTIETTNGLDYNPCGGWIIYSEGQLQAVNDAYNMENLDALKKWAVFEFVSANQEILALENDKFKPAKIDDYNSDKKAAESVLYSMFLSDEVSMLYTELAYDEETDSVLRSLIDDIIQGYEDKISNTSWLSDGTKDLLLKKLENIVVYTAKDFDTDIIDEKKAACFTGNYWESQEKLLGYFEETMTESLSSGYPENKSPLPMNSVNACYTRDNRIIITLAILQDVIFSKDRSYAENLGSIGAVIAHEIGHAFDSSGLDYDYSGKLNPDWISDEDKKAFETKNDEAIFYFEQAVMIDGIYSVDGELTLDENLADLSGIEVCTSLLTSEEDLKTFFERYAFIFSELLSYSDLDEYLSYQDHSPGIVRVNAILASNKKFVEIYGIEEGDGMYINPLKRISRWE